MSIKYLSCQLFVQNGHLLEALVQFEENGMQVIKAVQLDSASRCLVEVPAENVTFLPMASSASIDLNISLNEGGHKRHLAFPLCLNASKIALAGAAA